MANPLFYAGQELTAAALNAAFPLRAFADADTSRTSSTTFLDADGLVVELEANSQYAIDGWLAYDAGVTGDLKVQLLVPTGAGGTWGMYALSTTSTGSVGTVQANRAPVGSGNALTAGGSASSAGAMNALLRGYIATGDDPGELQVQFAQNTSNATATTIKAGSWIRAQKINADAGFVGLEAPPPVGGGGGGARPYFDAADWHWDPIPASPTLDTNSAAIVAKLGDESKQHVLNLIEFGNVLRGPDGISALTTRYTVDMEYDAEWGDAFPPGATMPIPDDIDNGDLAPGSDKHLSVADPSTNGVYSLWIANKTGGSWEAGWGGYTDLDGEGREETGGSTGSGISRFACVIRESEIAAGEIPHALFFASNMVKGPNGGSNWKYPATKTDGQELDGSLSSTEYIWEGARVQLNPALDPDSYTLNDGERAIFIALQTYGAYCGDNGGSSGNPRMAILCELSPTHSDDYPGDGYDSAGIDGDYYNLDAIPWSQLRVLKNWDGSA